MIFATVGTQGPFDRLLAALDSWAARHPEARVVAQTGRTVERFPHIEAQERLDQTALARALEEARVIVAHAGKGTILSARQLGKPVILMPRRAALGEDPTDRQMDTAAELANLADVTVVNDAEELALALDRILSQRECCDTSSAYASPQLIARLRQFIFDEPPTGTETDETAAE